MRVSHDKAPYAERKDVDIPDSDFLSAVRAIREPTSFSTELAFLALPASKKVDGRGADRFSRCIRKEQDSTMTVPILDRTS